MRAFVALLMLLLSVPAPSVWAQGSPLDFFRQNPQPSPFFWRQERQPPSLGRPRAVPTERSRPRILSAPRDERVVVSEPAVPPTHFVHVIGDSLAELLAQGLKERLAETSPTTAVVRRTRSSSGLVRDDYYDWPKAMAELFAGGEKIDALVVMMGSNDRQTLRDEAGSHEFRSDRWRELYVRRVDQLLALAREKQIPVQWVGMPIMQAPRLSADMVYLNDLFRERVVATGGIYTDIWEAFTGPEGDYAANGPDTNGQAARLRTADGIHFTRSGLGKLGFFASRDTMAILKPGTERPAIAALPRELSEQVQGSGGAASAAADLSLPLPGSLDGLPLFSEKPLAGPVIELTAAPVSADGKLLTRRPPFLSAGNLLATEQALAHGVPPQPKPGRADDHRWRAGPTGSIAPARN